MLIGAKIASPNNIPVLSFPVYTLAFKVIVIPPYFDKLIANID